LKSLARAFGAHNSGKAHGNAHSHAHDPARPRRRHWWVRLHGYIAGYCIAQLLDEGWCVRTTVRNLSRAEEVRRTIGKIATNAGAIEFAAADLNSDGGWANAVAGGDYVLHVASPVPVVDPKTDDELVRPARDGTLRVLKAARDADMKRVVMTSSISAIIVGWGVREKPFTEADWTAKQTAATHLPMIEQRQLPSAQRGHGTMPKAGRSNLSPSTPA
jgi:3-beta hydroxysteroid dehydrogenase/isomerase family